MAYFVTQMADWEGISALRIRRDAVSRQVYLVACNEDDGREVDVLVLSNVLKIVVVGPETFTVAVTLLTDKVRFRPVTSGFEDWAGTMALDHAYEMVRTIVKGNQWVLPFLDPDEPAWDDNAGYENPFRG